MNEVLVFLDDLIVFSKTLEEHETRLMKFFKSSIKYLGHVVDGVHTDPEKIYTLKDWLRPSTR